MTTKFASIEEEKAFRSMVKKENDTKITPVSVEAEWIDNASSKAKALGVLNLSLIHI